MQMTSSQLLGIKWFACGVLCSMLVLSIMHVRNVELLISGVDGGAVLALGILATVQFGVVMPVTCVLVRYHRDRFNFWNAFLLLLGFTIGGGMLVVFYGYFFLALLYMFISSGILTALYLFTHTLHHRMNDPKNKNHP
jgi:hypothetical protein